MVISFIQFAVFSFELQFNSLLKFIYSEKATKFCEIFTLLLSYIMPVKSKVKILQNFVAFSEYMNFNSRNFADKSRILQKLFKNVTNISTGIQLLTFSINQNHRYFILLFRYGGLKKTQSFLATSASRLSQRSRPTDTPSSSEAWPHSETLETIPALLKTLWAAQSKKHFWFSNKCFGRMSVL